MSDIRFNRWLHQSGTGGVYQDSSGRVGIGSTNPDKKFQVFGTGGNFISEFYNTNNASSNNGVYIRTENINNATVPLSVNSGIGGTNQLMVVRADGSIGIGTVNPTLNSKVEIYGTDANLQVHYTNNSRGGIAALLNQRLAIYTTAAADHIVFGRSTTDATSISGTNFTEHVRINNTTGNLGIGTTNPNAAYKLHVSDVGGTIAFHNSSNANTIRYANTNTTAEWSAGTSRPGLSNAADFYSITQLGTDSTWRERFTVDSSGRITTPYQPAFLAYSTGVSVTGGWSNLSSSLTTEAYDIGGNYGSSTAGRFVAPVAGRYLFYFGGFGNGSTVNERYAVCARINGGSLNYISGGSYAITDTPLSGYSVVHNLAVNDYVELFYYTAIANTWGASVHYVYWGGYLLG